MSTTPSHDEWRRLLTTADALRTSGLLDWITEDDVFAVEDPATRELGFVVVAHDDESAYPTVMLLMGSGGLRVREAIQWHFFVDQTDLQTRQNALVVTYDNREELQESLGKVVDEIELTFDDGIFGSPARFLPGVFPHGISALEANLLSDALEQALAVFPRLQDDDQAFEHDDSMLVRVLHESEWSDEWRELSTLIVETPLTEFEPPRDMIDRVSSVSETRGIWEYGAMYAPIPIDPASGPELACIHLIADKSGRTFNEEVGTRRDAQGLCEFLITAIEKSSRRPQTLQIADEEVAAAVAKLLIQTGIALELVDHLEYIGADYANLLKPIAES